MMLIAKKSQARKVLMVGAERFELPTLWSQTRCATRLRYAPMYKILEVLYKVKNINASIFF